MATHLSSVASSATRVSASAIVLTSTAHRPWVAHLSASLQDARALESERTFVSTTASIGQNCVTLQPATCQAGTCVVCWVVVITCAQWRITGCHGDLGRDGVCCATVCRGHVRSRVEVKSQTQNVRHRTVKSGPCTFHAVTARVTASDQQALTGSHSTAKRQPRRPHLRRR